MDLVTKLISMDADECHALAALGGWNIPDRHPGLFLEHLYDVIEKHHLHEFFGVYPERPAMFRDDVRTHGIDWTTEEVDKSEMAAWQKASSIERYAANVGGKHLVAVSRAGRYALNEGPIALMARRRRDLCLAVAGLFWDRVRPAALYPGW